MRAYVDDRMADRRAKWRKLKRDWREAEAATVELSGVKRVRHAKFYDHCRKILLSSGDNVLSFDARSSSDSAEIVFRGVADNTISTFDIDEEKQRFAHVSHMSHIFPFLYLFDYEYSFKSQSRRPYSRYTLFDRRLRVHFFLRNSRTPTSF